MREKGKDSAGYFKTICNSVLLLSFSLLLLEAVQASESVSATKRKNPDGTYSSTPGSFTITTTQEILWEANYFGEIGTDGNGFYIHRPGADLDDEPISTSLRPGLNRGAYYLDTPGTYHISIDYMLMGPGNYTIFYNRTASIRVSPSSHDFTGILESESSSPYEFTISHTGDRNDYPVTIEDVLSSDLFHFEVIGPPRRQEVPPDRTFQLQFHARSDPGPHSANISVSGTSAVSVTPVIVTATGETLEREPDIVCGRSGTPNLGSADWFTGVPEILDYSFQNDGTEELIIYGIDIENDPPTSSAFSLESASEDPLPSDRSRPVRIRFAPSEEGGEADYYGVLVIRSNDPDEPTKRCRFMATAHHPVPILRLETTEIDYGEVEIGYRFTRAAIVRNIGDAELTFNVSVEGGIDPADLPFELSLGHFRIPAAEPGDEESFLLPMTFAPEDAVPSEVTLIVDGSNDPTWESGTLYLHGIGVEPVPLSTMLLMDRSGSMDGHAGEIMKIEAARDAGVLYAQILNDGFDWIGITRYNETAQIMVPLAPIGDNRDAAIALLNDITGRMSPDGNTCIGCAMQTASEEYATPESPQDHQAMILLTDGKENVSPEMLDVAPDIRAAHPNLRIFSVGIGNAIRTGPYEHEGIEAEKLQEVSEGTNGYFGIIETLSEERRYDLMRFYFKALAIAKGHSFARDPTHTVYLSNTLQKVDSVYIAECDREANFLIISELLRDPSYRLLIQLEDPTGQIINPASTVGGVNVHTKEWENVRFIRIKFPPRSMSSSYSGVWKLFLQPVEVTTPTLYTHAEVVVTQRPFTYIAFLASVGSDYRMQASLTRGTVFVNQPIHLGAILTEAWWPAPEGAVSVQITKPDGSVVHHDLFDNGLHADGETGDAEFGWDFRDTGQEGYYEFYFRGTGRTERGETVVREMQLTKFVVGYRKLEGPSPHRLQGSFHVGATYPVAHLDSLNDSNIHVRGDLSYRLNDRIQLMGMVGLSQFTAEPYATIAHHRWVNCSVNLKTDFSALSGTGLKYYVQAGPGYYLPKAGSNEFGFNVGLGGQIFLSPPFTIEFGVDYHHILTTDPVKFLTFQLGVLFR